MSDEIIIHIDAARRGEFVIDGIEGKFAGYTRNKFSHGYFCPGFTRAEADRIMAALNEHGYPAALYVESTDRYMTQKAALAPVHIWAPAVWETMDGEQVLYEIGDAWQLTRWLKGTRPFRTEFDELRFQVPAEIVALVDNGTLVDMSWHNEACPHFGRVLHSAPKDIGEHGNDGVGFRLDVWVDAKHVENREYANEHRYLLILTPIRWDDTAHDYDTTGQHRQVRLMETEDLPAVIAEITRLTTTDMKPFFVAYEFSRAMGADLKNAEKRQIIALNQTEPYQHGACATHDFLDANQYMLDAFERVLGRTIRISDEDGTEAERDADLELTSATWRIAREKNFFWE